MKLTLKKIFATALAITTSTCFYSAPAAKAMESDNTETSYSSSSLGTSSSSINLETDPSIRSLETALFFSGLESDSSDEELAASAAAEITPEDKILHQFETILSEFPGLKREIERQGITYEVMSYEQFRATQPTLMGVPPILDSDKFLTCVHARDKFIMVINTEACERIRDHELFFLSAYAAGNLFDTVISCHYIPELLTHIKSPSASLPCPRGIVQKLVDQDVSYNRWLTYDCYPTNGLPIPTTCDEVTDRVDEYSPNPRLPQIDGNVLNRFNLVNIARTTRIASPYLNGTSDDYRENRHCFATMFAVGCFDREREEFGGALRSLIEFYHATFLI